MTRKSNLNTIRSINKWCIYWSSRNKSYASLVLFDHKITEFLTGLFYALRMPSSYYVIRRYYTDLVLIEADVQILDFRRLRRFVYVQRWFYLVVASFRKWLRRFIFIRRFSSRDERFSFLESLSVVNSISRSIYNTKYFSRRRHRRFFLSKLFSRIRALIRRRSGRRQVRTTVTLRRHVLRRHVALRSNFMNIKTMLRFLNMQAVSNYYKGAIRRHLLCLIPLVRISSRYKNRKSRRKIHCSSQRKRYSLRINRRSSPFSSSFCKTVLWRLRQSCHVRSRFNDTLSSSKIVPISSAIIFKARSAVSALNSSNNKINYITPNNAMSYFYNKQTNVTKYRRYYSTNNSFNRTAPYSTTIYNKPDKRHVPQRAKDKSNPCHRHVTYSTNISNQTDNVNVKYNTMKSGELRHYDSMLWLFLKKHRSFELYLEYYSLCHDVDLSQINGIRNASEYKFDPMAGYKPRALAFNEDYDDLSTDREVYRRTRTEAEERRLASIEHDLRKKRAANKMLLWDINAASSRKISSVKPSAVLMSELNSLGTQIDEKCSADGLVSSHPMLLIPAEKLAEVRLSYLQATIMKSFHALTRDKIYSKKQEEFFAYCSYKNNLSSRIHANISSFLRSPSSYFWTQLTNTLLSPTKWNVYSFFIFFSFLLLICCVYIVWDFYEILHLQAELEVHKAKLNEIFTLRRKLIDSSHIYMWLSNKNYDAAMIEHDTKGTSYGYFSFLRVLSLGGLWWQLGDTFSSAYYYFLGGYFNSYMNSKVVDTEVASYISSLKSSATIYMRHYNDLNSFLTADYDIHKNSASVIESELSTRINYSEALPGIFSFINAYGFSFFDFMNAIMFFIFFSILVSLYANSEYYKSTLANRFLSTRDVFSTVFFLTYLIVIVLLCAFPFLWNWYCDILTDSIFSLPSYQKTYVFADCENIDDYGWDEDECSGVHENPFIRFLLVLPKEGSAVIVSTTIFVYYKTYHLLFEMCVFVYVFLFLMFVMIALHIFFYPLVVANNQRRFDDLCSRTIQYSWAWVDSDVRNYKPTEIHRVQTYIFKTHLEGWQNLVKLSLFILFIYFTLPEVKIDWFLETIFLQSRENSPITYALYDNFIHLPSVIFFWCSNIYHTYRFYGYAVVYKKVMNNEIASIPFDECLDYRRRVVLILEIIVAVLFFYLYYIFLFTQ